MNDAIFYYMFVNLGESATTDDLLLYAEDNASPEVIANANKALTYLLANWKNTALDGTTPEDISDLTDSCIYFYMYIAVGGADAATSEDLASFSTDPSNTTKAEAALQLLNSLNQ